MEIMAIAKKEDIFLFESSKRVRQHLWQLFLTHSALIDELLDRFTLEAGTEVGQASLATIQDNFVDLNNPPEQVLNNSDQQAHIERTVKRNDTVHTS